MDRSFDDDDDDGGLGRRGGSAGDGATHAEGNNTNNNNNNNNNHNNNNNNDDKAEAKTKMLNPIERVMILRVPKTAVSRLRLESLFFFPRPTFMVEPGVCFVTIDKSRFIACKNVSFYLCVRVPGVILIFILGRYAAGTDKRARRDDNNKI